MQRPHGLHAEENEKITPMQEFDASEFRLKKVKV
jgi:hypothetical protein